LQWHQKLPADKLASSEEAQAAAVAAAAFTAPHPLTWGVPAVVVVVRCKTKIAVNFKKA